jgi:hypothetical protein
MATVTTSTLAVTIAPGQTETLNMMTYLPTNYVPGQAYPLLVFFPGAGEIGTNAALLQVHGPFLYLKSGVDLGLNLIVVALQNFNANPRPAEVQGCINALKALYNVSALVGTGLSRGGQDWDWFISNAQSQTNEMAGLCLASSQSTGGIINEPGAMGGWEPAWMAAAKIPYWQACGTNDSFYSNYTTENGTEVLTSGILWKYQQYKALAPSLAFLDTWPGVGHGDPVWSDLYNPAWMSPSTGKSIYQWAAALGAAVTTPPVGPPLQGPLCFPQASTAQLSAISLPVAGDAYFNTTTGKTTYWNGTSWV